MTTVREDREYVKKVLSCVLENTIDWISINMSPEDVFKRDDLDMWANNNGYVNGEE